ncbi:hypothetical protein [Sphingobacterium sp. LRF_L2]|uniref:hypothetical protein n=1 Tax=Sphingobacterium sp. LRF_L2 TaxID=3369421 RepID=UPI003F61ADD7
MCYAIATNQQTKRLLTILVTILLFGCGHTEKKSDGKWKTIEVGYYLFDFPADFELVPEKGIDSYVGMIKGDSMCFGFDFGYYSSDFEPTAQEYLDNGFWRNELSYRFMKEGITYDQRNTPKVDIMSIRPATIQDSTIGKGCDYVAKCKHDQTEFDIAIYIPDEIKQTNYSIDTVDYQYRKIVWSKDPRKGTTGIYIRDMNGFNESINGYLALSMATFNLTSKQQETALKIFKTGRVKNQSE